MKARGKTGEEDPRDALGGVKATPKQNRHRNPQRKQQRVYLYRDFVVLLRAKIQVRLKLGSPTQNLALMAPLTKLLKAAHIGPSGAPSLMMSHLSGGASPITSPATQATIGGLKILFAAGPPIMLSLEGACRFCNILIF